MKKLCLSVALACASVAFAEDDLPWVFDTSGRHVAEPVARESSVAVSAETQVCDSEESEETFLDTLMRGLLMLFK